MSKQTDLQAEYEAQQNALKTNIVGLEALINEHYAKNQGRIDWGHIGDLKHVNEQLREALDFLAGQEELA